MKTLTRLPEEVMVEILLRLPLKSLMRFKSVCNSWHDLITDPSFINKHLLLNANNGKTSSSTTLILRWTLQGLSLDDILKCNFSEDHRHDKQVLSLVTIFDRDDDDDNNDQIPCVLEELNMPLIPSDTIFLCNPSLREFKLISAPCLPTHFASAEFGFGYDPKANDYKFVRILNGADYGVGSNMASRAQVYSLGTDSWREIKMDTKVRYYRGRRKGVYLRGVYYWWINALPYYNDMILSFDMCDERFQRIPLPDEVQRFGAEWRSLAVWNESLVLFFSAQNSWFSTSFEKWVMLDIFGADEGVTPWIKHLTVRATNSDSLPCGILER
ncbi:F-box domain containing protein [Parasponia andersonii]|uniref:F-box domain containing protein n=1 Tax=Parasponia andersonii TaxID=3476 RepID=A0A2P5BZF3_PARAD|nr:F-box domain containing protein [Parasponia andersonii]